MITSRDCLLTFDELLALIVALPGFDFITFMYAPDGEPGWIVSAFTDDGSVECVGDTPEDAMFLLFISAISGGIRRN